MDPELTEYVLYIFAFVNDYPFIFRESGFTFTQKVKVIQPFMFTFLFPQLYLKIVLSKRDQTRFIYRYFAISELH